MKTLAQQIDEAQARKDNGFWIPACGGTEKPFTTRTGRRLQYMYQPSTGNHAYYDIAADIFLSDDEADRALAI